MDNSRRRCYRALSVFNFDNKAVTAMWRAMLRLCPVALIFATFVPGAYAWTWPVRGPVLETFSFDPAHPYAAGQHRGIAIGADGGTPVLAPAPGVVSFAGTVPTNGLTVTIQTADGLAVSLTHLGSVTVDRSARVVEGAAVGTVGPSGTAEFPVPYVHLGIRTASTDQGYLDPLGFLPALPAPAPQAAPGPAPQAAPEPAPQAAPAATAAPAAPAGTASQAAPAGAVAPAAPAGAQSATAPTSQPAQAPAVPAPAVGSPAPATAPAAPVEPAGGLVVAPSRARKAAAPAASSDRAPAARDPLGARPRTVAPIARSRRVPVHGERGRLSHRVSHRLRRVATASRPAGAPRLQGRLASSEPPIASHHRVPRVLVAFLALAVAVAAGLGLAAARMIMSPSPASEGASTEPGPAEDPRRSRLAVRQRAAAPRPRRGSRGPVRHLRALPPAEGQRRGDGERDGRARHAGDGLRRPRRRLAA
jgi:hypothetical protein